MIEFEIDGKTVTSEPGKTIIEVADTIDVYIPRFCYHNKLSVAANCRMCLVEVEKSGKPLPACATPITGGMKVFTRSAKALAAQRAVMEYLLINHPLDCPICDQGGECELQDLAMGYGRGASRYNQGKRSVYDKDLGPLVESCMTRCIQCTRCVRFGDEIAGMRELGAYNRGENLEIGTYVQRAMRSELSGNVIDICPVGALTSKPYRFTARAWEMRQQPSIAPHDCLGSNIYVHTRGEILEPIRNVMRVVPQTNELINEVWLSDRDRFSYEGLHSTERITQPMIKQQKQWQKTDWETALALIHKRLHKIIKEEGANKIGALASPSLTIEEFYLLQKLMRGLGSHNIDHRIHQLDFSDQQHFPLYPQLGLPIKDIEKLDVILLIGANVRQEQPLLNLRIRKAVLQGAKVFCINTMDDVFNFDVEQKMIVGSELLVAQIAKIVKTFAPRDKDLPEIRTNEEAKVFAEALKGEKVAIFLGAQALHHPEASAIRALTYFMAKKLNAAVGELTLGANSAGAWIGGAIPHRGVAATELKKSGLNAGEMFKKPLSAYLLMGIEPELDCAYAGQAMPILEQANFVVAINSFISPSMEKYADVILPAAPFTETEGTYVNVEGRWQQFAAVGPCQDQAKSGWRIVQELGNSFGLEGFTYANANEIYQELNETVAAAKLPVAEFPLPDEITVKSGLFRQGEWPMYRIDSLVRRSKPLQETSSQDIAGIYINPNLAAELELAAGQTATAQQGDTKITLPVFIDCRVPDHNVYIPMGLKETAGFGLNYGAIKLQKE